MIPTAKQIFDMFQEKGITPVFGKFFADVRDDKYVAMADRDGVHCGCAITAFMVGKPALDGDWLMRDFTTLTGISTWSFIHGFDGLPGEDEDAVLGREVRQMVLESGNYRGHP